jgi:hypothetical protein
MHTDPFGWLLPKNDRLLWVRVSHLPEAHRLWSRPILPPHNATCPRRSLGAPQN